MLLLQTLGGDSVSVISQARKPRPRELGRVEPEEAASLDTVLGLSALCQLPLLGSELPGDRAMSGRVLS